MLLIRRFEQPVPRIRRHGGIGIGEANLFVLAALPLLLLLRSLLATVHGEHFLHLARGKALPAHISPDQRSVDMDDFAGGNLGLKACRNGALKDPPEAFRAPALADARQA
jgi:hypothetical protein